jgi:hypothetical protein
MELQLWTTIIELIKVYGYFYAFTGPVRTVIAGGIGGVILWTVIFPADVVKSRIQVNRLNVTMIACMTDIAKREGMWSWSFEKIHLFSMACSINRQF